MSSVDEENIKTHSALNSQDSNDISTNSRLTRGRLNDDKANKTGADDFATEPDEAFNRLDPTANTSSAEKPGEETKRRTPRQAALEQKISIRNLMASVGNSAAQVRSAQSKREAQNSPTKRPREKQISGTEPHESSLSTLPTKSPARKRKRKFGTYSFGNKPKSKKKTPTSSANGSIAENSAVADSGEHDLMDTSGEVDEQDNDEESNFSDDEQDTAGEVDATDETEPSHPQQPIFVDTEHRTVSKQSKSVSSAGSTPKISPESQGMLVPPIRIKKENVDEYVCETVERESQESAEESSDAEAEELNEDSPADEAVDNEGMDAVCAGEDSPVGDSPVGAGGTEENSPMGADHIDENSQIEADLTEDEVVESAGEDREDGSESNGSGQLMIDEGGADVAENDESPEAVVVKDTEERLSNRADEVDDDIDNANVENEEPDLNLPTEDEHLPKVDDVIVAESSKGSGEMSIMKALLLKPRPSIDSSSTENSVASAVKMRRSGIKRKVHYEPSESDFDSEDHEVSLITSRSRPMRSVVARNLMEQAEERRLNDINVVGTRTLRKSTTGAYSQQSNYFNVASNDVNNDVFTTLFTKRNLSTKCHCAKVLHESEIGHGIRALDTCQALDSIDGKLIGCNNDSMPESFYRPAIKIPFRVFCRVHYNRLKMHQCCPGCGVFCTQGKFIQCQFQSPTDKHYFHKKCGTFNDEPLACLHCVAKTKLAEVKLTLYTYYRTQLEMYNCVQNRPFARMTIPKRDIVIESSQKTETLILPQRDVVIDMTCIPVENDRAELVAALSSMENIPDPIIKWNESETVSNLYDAARDNNIKALLFALVEDANPDTRYPIVQNRSALSVACLHGHFIAVHILAQVGANLNCVDDNLTSVLMFAAEGGSVTVVEYLVRKEVLLNLQDANGLSALHIAAKQGFVDVVKVLMGTRKIYVNIQDNAGKTALVHATENNRVDVAKFLLENEGDPTITDNEHNSALHWAAAVGNRELCQLYLAKGCNVNVPNANGDTSMHRAVVKNHVDCILFLLSQNVDCKIKNKDGLTVLEVDKSDSLAVHFALKSYVDSNKYVPVITGSEVILHNDVSMGREKFPIQCVNSVDDVPFPFTDFTYVTQNCSSSDVQINRAVSTLQHCRCLDNCSKLTCSCGQLNKKVCYDEKGRLRDEFYVAVSPLIFECNLACRCWSNCFNRVVQRGSLCRLQVFRTALRGWGVRTVLPILKGTFVCQYAGEIISESETKTREDSYIFDMDANEVNDSADKFCLDGRNYGNVSRFLNHFCDPNLTVVKVFTETQDLRFPNIAFFACRDISAYEELGFNYGSAFWMVKGRTISCTCGSTRCEYSTDKILHTLENIRNKEKDMGFRAVDQLDSAGVRQPDDIEPMEEEHD